MRWIAVGDIHEQTDMLARIPGIREADGVLISGDLTNRGTAGAAREVIEAVRRYNANIYSIMGNMDTMAVAEYLDKAGVGLHLKVRDLTMGGGRPRVGALGVGFSTPTPFATPGEVPEEQLGQWLEQAWQLTDPYDYIVAVIHNPPIKTKTDDLGDGTHVGSKAVRRFIKDHSPAVVVTGHIHEAKSTDYIGSTTIINTGMLAHGGYAVLTLENGRVKAVLEQVD